MIKTLLFNRNKICLYTCSVITLLPINDKYFLNHILLGIIIVILMYFFYKILLLLYL